MAVVVNEFEVEPQESPAREAQDGAGGKQPQGGGTLQPEALRQIQTMIRISHERKRRLAAC